MEIFEKILRVVYAVIGEKSDHCQFFNKENTADCLWSEPGNSRWEAGN